MKGAARAARSPSHAMVPTIVRNRAYISRSQPSRPAPFALNATTAGQNGMKIQDRGSLTCATPFEIIELNKLSGVTRWPETCMYEIWTMT